MHGELKRCRRRAGSTLVALVAGSLTLVFAAGPATAAKPITRYSIAGGCYSVAPAGSGQPLATVSQQRLKATRLGSYMLYGTANDWLTASGTTAIRSADTPGPAADWKVSKAGKRSFRLSPAAAADQVLAENNGALALVPAVSAGASSHFKFVRASGCVKYPEAQLNVAGRPARGRTYYGETKGILDGHMHWMTFEYLGGNFHCGRPWSPYGITVSLPDCSGIEGPQGAAAPIQNFLNFGSPVSPHDTTGWPAFTEWDPGNLTYEGTYYRWVQRAYKAGLRMMVMPVNENRVLCTLMATRRNSCDEMETVRLGIKDIKQMQRYVDAQAGGPGKGWFRIVRNPFQARRVINKGKMAVVLEVEVSELFDCRGSVPASCGEQIVDNGLDELRKLGVRSSLLLNKFDNPLTGVRFDGGPIGFLINAANRESYGSFWNAETCTGPEHDNTIESGQPDASSLLTTLITTLGVPPGTLPTYPPAPHCNTRGLTDLGAYTVKRMMDRGMIVNPDHMSQQGVDATIGLAEKRHYSGVISPHGWMDPLNWPRVWKLGGMAFPGAGSAAGFASTWKTYRPKRTPYYFGWGYGADLGGLAHQGEPVAEGSPTSVTYPFKSLDGKMTINKQRSGDRVFDYSKDGVAHYGEYADWYEEVRKTAGRKEARDMLRGSEAYLQMWERSVGIRSPNCKHARQHFGRKGIGRLRLGMYPKRLLKRNGQPIRRTRAWSWCVGGKHNHHTSETAVLTRKGRVALVASTAHANKLRGVGRGARSAKLKGLPKGARRNGIWATGHGRKAAVYLIRHGRVRMTAVTSRRLARHGKRLRSYLRRVPRRGVSKRSTTVVGAVTAKLTAKNATPLVAQRGGGQFPYFCGL